jgi:tight adherence protein B
MNPSLLVSMLAGLAVFLIFFGIDRVIAGSSSMIESRLGRYASRPIGASSSDQIAGRKPQQGRLNRMLAASAGSQIATDLARADLKLTTSEFVLANIACIMIGFLMGLVVFRANLALALVGAVVGFFAPRWYISFLQRKRLNAFNGQLGDTIILLSNSLRSGYSLLQSMETVSKELPPPISVEFGRVTREIGLGLTVQEALANLLRRIPSEDLDLMITAINVQHEVGGNLAEILDTIAFTIRERVRIVGEIRSITAQQRLSSSLLSILHILLGLVLYALNPSYVSGLWSNLCGWIMMVTGGTLIVLGYFIIRKIVDIEV